MKTQAALILTVFFGLLALISSQDQGQVYCGRRLATTLGLLCKNGLIKRSDPRYDTALDFGGEEYGFPWISVHHARSMGRGKRQVVSECCEKPCTISELLSYCME